MWSAEIAETISNALSPSAIGGLAELSGSHIKGKGKGIFQENQDPGIPKVNKSLPEHQSGGGGCLAPEIRTL